MEQHRLLGLMLSVSVLTACGGGGETPTSPNVAIPEKGKLQLVITGLSTGSLANITITGPNGFSQTATASQTLTGLTAGEYTINATNVVDKNGLSFQPNETARKLTVTASKTETLTVSFKAPSAAQGVLSGFGSVIVNGTRFNTDDATFSSNDDDATQADLKAGMQITVIGQQTADGSEAQAQHVDYDANAKGRIDAIDLAKQRVTVLGTEFQFTENTVFDDVRLDQLSVGSFVEISAFSTESQGFLVTYIGIEQDHTQWQLQGGVTALDTTKQQFILGTLLIDYSEDAPTELQNGHWVTVKAAYAPSSSAWTVYDLDIEQQHVDYTSLISFSGLVSDLKAGEFTLEGKTVKFDTTTQFEDDTSELTNGVLVEVKGIASNTEVLADSIDIEERIELELEGTISSINETAQSFVVHGKTIFVSANTLYRDDDSHDSLFNFSRLAIGDFVELDLAAQGSDFVALKIERESKDAATTQQLTGYVTDIKADSMSFSVAGIVVQTAAYTEFEIEDQDLTHTAFFNQLALGMEVDVTAYVPNNTTNSTLLATEVEVDLDKQTQQVEIQGEVSSVTPLTVNGFIILSDEHTEYDDVTAGTISIGQMLHIEGIQTQDSSILAEEIEAKNSHSDIDVELNGQISALTDSHFTVQDQQVHFNADTQFDNGIASDLVEGVYVEVEAEFNREGQLVAEEIEFKSADLLKITGVISVAEQNMFTIDGQDFHLADDVEFDNGNASKLAQGITVTVYYTVVNNKNRVEKIEFEEVRNGTLKGAVTEFENSNNFKLLGHKIQLTAQTEFSDGNAALVQLDSMLEVEGNWDAQGVLIATKAKFIDDTKNQLQANIDSVNEQGFVLNGVVVILNTSTEFANGTRSDLSATRLVLVEGQVIAGVLHASLVDFK